MKPTFFNTPTPATTVAKIQYIIDTRNVHAYDN